MTAESSGPKLYYLSAAMGIDTGRLDAKRDRLAVDVHTARFTAVLRWGPDRLRARAPDSPLLSGLTTAETLSRRPQRPSQDTRKSSPENLGRRKALSQESSGTR